LGTDAVIVIFSMIVIQLADTRQLTSKLESKVAQLEAELIALRPIFDQQKEDLLAKSSMTYHFSKYLENRNYDKLIKYTQLTSLMRHTLSRLHLSLMFSCDGIIKKSGSCMPLWFTGPSIWNSLLLI